MVNGGLRCCTFQAKVELMEVVDFFRRPEKFRTSGAKAPKGVLLVGPPGNGKVRGGEVACTQLRRPHAGCGIQAH